jgi:hypothetical protein
MTMQGGDPRVCPFCWGADQHKLGCKMLEEPNRLIDLFHWVSLFKMTWPSQADLDAERLSLQDTYKVKLGVFEIQTAGAEVSLVVWKRV